MLHVIVTAFKRSMDLKRLIYDFLLQTDSSWDMRIIHDGPAPDGIAQFVSSLGNERVKFEFTPEIKGFWGHPNRGMMLEKTQGDPDDYVLITNDDNQYVKSFVEFFLKNCGPKVGFVFCNTIHNYFKYNILLTEIRVGGIDMGSFIVKLSVAQKIGFVHREEMADGMYAVECAAECTRQGLEIIRINKALFVHN